MELNLIFLENGAEESRVTLPDGEHVIGRDDACEVIIESDSISRRHARLTIAEAGVYLQDLGSANGTFINGHRVDGRVLLESGQRVQLGTVPFEVRWSLPVESSPREPAQPEQVLQGRKYEMGNVVALGGMGVVRRAQDLHVRRDVAIKSMSETKKITPAKRLRFVEEAQVTGQLEHPNIVPVYDLGIDEAGKPFYTMKFVRGITLRTVLDDILNLKADAIAQYPLGRLLTIFQKACDAVAFAHSKGVIHRDLKPDNIMIGDFGEVLVMDWGLSKRLGKQDTATVRDSEPPDSAAHTADGAVIGTPHFMSPEQANGLGSQIDARTDIFTLGGVLYNILTLQAPFPGETTEESLQLIRTGQITPPAKVLTPLQHCPGRKIPESLAAVALKALAMRPEDRYQTIRELQKDIEAYQGGFATSAEQAGTLKLLRLLVKRRKFEFTLIAGAAATLLIVGGIALQRTVASERVVRKSLEALRASAPAYASQAESLIDEHQFEAALAKVATALDLTPDKPDLYVLKGNILESLLRLLDARTAYAEALRLDPGNTAAQVNLELCDRLLRDNTGFDELAPASLNELQDAMLRQQRSAEALAMVRRLGKDTQALFDTWKTVLQRAGLLDNARGPARLVVDDTGTFYLNLSRTKTDNIAALKDMPVKELHLALSSVRDLSPLHGAPLAVLNLAGTPITDIEPLRGMPVKVLVLTGCRNLRDLSPLCECRQLETLLLPPDPVSIECLRQLPKLARIANIKTLAAAREDLPKQLSPAEARARGLAALLDETMPAEEFWKQHPPAH
jgi:serine/threonine protein kinase